MVDEAGETECDGGSRASFGVFSGVVEEVVIEQCFAGDSGVFWGENEEILAEKDATFDEGFRGEDAATFVGLAEIEHVRRPRSCGSCSRNRGSLGRLW